MPATRSCAVAIIGAGSAGLAAHAAARRHIDSLLLIEGGEHGTTCARTGCMPSKLLVAAGEARHRVDEAGQFGIDAQVNGIDGRAVMARVRALRDRFVNGVLAVVERLPGDHRLAGSAAFVEPDLLQVGDQQVRAGCIVIATGSAPFVPPPYRQLGDRLLTSDTIFELDDLPRSLAVIGGGSIGLELGQAMHRLGVRVRLFERGGRLGPRGDHVVEPLATALYGERLPCELGVTAEVGEVDAGGVELRWQRHGSDSPSRERFERVLVATGRRPNLAALQLERSGLALDARGVPLFDRQTLRCGDSRIFIAGDVDGDRPLLHEAAEEGRIAGANAARFPQVRAQRRHTRLTIAFCDPQYATIGVQPGEPAAVGAAVGEVSFEDQGRSRVIARNAGIGRLYGDPASGKLIGAQLVGPQAEHLAHLLAWVIEQELTVEHILALPFYHPVVEEGLRSALKDLRGALRRGPARVPGDCLECGPGT